jgi:hypothetical protein
MAEDDIPSYLVEHMQDYYGKCEADIFIESSVLLNIPPNQGTEERGFYKIDYNVSYNVDGIVVLGRSFDIIDGVLCTLH